MGRTSYGHRADIMPASRGHRVDIVRTSCGHRVVITRTADSPPLPSSRAPLAALVDGRGAFSQISIDAESATERTTTNKHTET
eukprot:8924814-Alexandrium_andersonii.AAC.1